jgi:hypothetical protein
MTNEMTDQVREYVEASAAPISLAELAERRATAAPAGRPLGSRPAAPRSVALRPLVLRRPVVAAAAAVAVVAAGSAAAVTAASAGGAHPRPLSARPHVPAVHSKPAAVRLTAAVVQHIAQVSKAAIEPAGHVFVSYAETDEGIADGSGTLDITFSGQNFNSVSRQPSATSTFTERVVDGQIYTYGNPPPGQPLQWYHSTNQTQNGDTAIPDPRALLAALRPAAGFEMLGYQVVGGVRCEHLRATEVAYLPGKLLSLGIAWPTTLAGLDVWVDGHGVVQQMSTTFSGLDDQGHLNVEKQTVRFLDIGQPETIVAPSQYANQQTFG